MAFAAFAAALAAHPAWAVGPPAHPSDAAGRPFQPLPEGSIVIYRAANLIDGLGGPVRPNMSVVVDGPTIKEIAPTAKVDTEAFDSATIVDLRGAYLLPGLIDSHTHLATPPNRRPAEAQLRRDLYGGVTAVRDMADDLRPVAEYARQALVGEIAAPDIYYAALFAGPDFFNDPRVLMDNDGVAPGSGPWMQAVTPATDVPLAIARAKGTSATGIKLYDNLQPSEVRTLTAEAHRQGLRVWAHGMVFPTPPADIVDAGVDAVSHTCYLAYQVSNPRPTSYKDRWPVESDKLRNGDNPDMTLLFRDMKARGTVLDATLRVYAEYDRELARHPAMKHKPYCTEALAVTLTRQALREGVTVVTGTDGTPAHQIPYPALDDELILLADKVGMDPAMVIRAATLEGAKVIGQEAVMGSVEPGKLANFVVLRSNPVEHMSGIRTVIFTVKRGRRFARTQYRPISAAEMPDEE